ncbi:MAG: hypothetical protein SGPRY_013507, partial [Prymnesium sp.]
MHSLLGAPPPLFRVETASVASEWVLKGRAEYAQTAVRCPLSRPNQTRPHCMEHCMKQANSPEAIMRVCRHCECKLCAICYPARAAWWSSSTGVLHSTLTATEPPFHFAYSPHDEDMTRMQHQFVLEPALTMAWYEATAVCCRKGGLVIDVGSNFGWYSLYSIALGCDVIAIEPTPIWQNVLRLGLAINPGFASKLRLFGNVIYNKPGSYTLHGPSARLPHAGRKSRFLGMTGMVGTAGLIKGYNKDFTQIRAPAVRLDDFVREKSSIPTANVNFPPLCSLTPFANVLPFSPPPQVFESATRLLRDYSVPALQFEITKGSKWRGDTMNAQTCMNLRMLVYLDASGFELREVNHKAVDSMHLPARSWAAEEVFSRLQVFPSNSSRRLAKKTGQHPMVVGFVHDIKTFSSNMVARRVSKPRARLEWPPEPHQ